MPIGNVIGNDLVDLRARDAAGKARDARFVARVFTPGEAARIESSPRPDRTLWLLWSGKEAAFKIAKKLRPGVPFAHSRYEVLPESEERALAVHGAEHLRGCVRLRGVPGLEDVCYPVEWEVTESFVHCIAVEAGGDSRAVWRKIASHEEIGLESGESAPSDRELASARTAESHSVRRLARALAREGGLGDVEIVREPAGTSFGPPRLYRVGGHEPLEGWDLSLSHDGELAAAAITGPARLR